MQEEGPGVPESTRLLSRAFAQGLDERMDVSHSLNSLKGCYIGDCIGDYYRGYEGGCPEFRLWLMRSCMASSLLQQACLRRRLEVLAIGAAVVMTASLNPET